MDLILEANSTYYTRSKMKPGFQIAAGAYSYMRPQRFGKASAPGFILEWVYPLEVKATASPSRKDTSGISAFRKSYPKLKIEKGLVIAPCAQFLPISEHDYAFPWDSE